MPNSLYEDAFGHHVWATLRLLDVCAELTPKQLDTNVPGTYGSIIDTMRHLVAADCGYLFVVSGGARAGIDEEGTELSQLRSEMEVNRQAWSELLTRELDAGADVVRHRDDGTDSHAPLAIRLAQVLHHGTDHRSQICTALTTLGIEPPEIDVWEFGRQEARVFVTPRSA